MDVELIDIPGVGKKFIEKFDLPGIHAVEDLKGKDPDALYRQYNEIKARHVDRCVLYLKFRSSD